MSTLDRINHIIVIYQENPSFDNYLRTLPGVDGIANARTSAAQTDKRGQAYDFLPAPLANPVNGIRKPHRISGGAAQRSVLDERLCQTEDGTANMAHAFDRQQYQINGGQMDRFVRLD